MQNRECYKRETFPPVAGRTTALPKILRSDMSFNARGTLSSPSYIADRVGLTLRYSSIG